MRVETITANIVHELLWVDPAAVLVGAYDNDEGFRMNALEGAISLTEFRRGIDSFPKDENVIFYCSCPHDEGAVQQAEECQKQGFLNVRVLQGGVNAWKSAGYGLVGTGV